MFFFSAHQRRFFRPTFSIIMTLAQVILLNHASAADAPTPIRFWPEGAPRAVGNGPEDTPTLTPFIAPADKATGGAFIVCPGGGYRGLADHEGKPIAEWLNSIGVSAFVLKYRHAPEYQHPVPLLDAQRAIRTVRSRADEWKIKSDKIGILGFSAGGHLTATAGTHFDAGNPNAIDSIDKVSCRPDAMVLIYPVITMTDKGHAGSRQNLLGDHPSQEMIDLLSNEKQVTNDTPPGFLVHGVNDRAVPYDNSLMFVDALVKARVPVELHLFEDGPHGFGLGAKDPSLSMWPELCSKWLKKHGF